MGFRIFSKIVIILGVVLVLVVIVEFMLLSLYEQDADVVKSTQLSFPAAGKLDGLFKRVKENSKNFTPSKKESNTAKYQVKSEDAKR